MAERDNSSGEKLIYEYRLVFSHLPKLRELAERYWDQVSLLKLEQDVVEKENQILNQTVIEMVDVLTTNFLFIKAMQITHTDIFDGAIHESLQMIDIVPDL